MPNCKVCGQPSRWPTCDRCAREQAKQTAREKIYKLIEEKQRKLERCLDAEAREWLRYTINKLENDVMSME